MPDSLLAFEEFQLDPGTGTLFRQGVPVPLAYRALLLLTALAQQSGHVVSKTDLMDAAWPGMAIEEGNLSVQIATLRKVLGPTADGGEMILTVPRVGYRFSPPVQRLPETNGQPSNTSEPEPPVGPSLAVLPFANLSDDPEQQYFADGLAEDIITQLSRLRWLFLSARNSSFTYQAKAVDVKQVGRELGVRYVLGGSVRRSGQRLRVTAQLSETTAGTQVWADRYESEIADFFALQDEITASVIAAIEPQLYAAEHKRLFRKPPESLDAWGHVMRAMPHVWTWGSSEDIDMAQSSLEKALAIDPGYAKAGSLLAWTYAARAHLGWVEPEPILAKAGAMAERAVQADPLDAWTHFSLGYVHMVSRRFGPAIEELTEVLTDSVLFFHRVQKEVFQSSDSETKSGEA